ncbi:CocE/NonD family hydrolase [Thiomicrorhabdus sp. ZW0627]|uniref:alpha/beta hydrolase n=1 Tax=Thiomicrorhabdus sp. ZW0627 TaxID=3039774 RepID=UPI0024362DEE|nr:CocE/NonD family hydrolase [Thiomicrorhabdus sp. ZW0627]MDG6774891.1 CocE/NonD family hydrolase [Thiomicrorhabdus sp. ZW0627]
MRSKSHKALIDGVVGPIEVRFFDASQQTGKDGSLSLVVISHPHPQFGGTMDNKVVTTIERAFQGLGYSTLTYNFRGVGQSVGEYDGGVGERQDLISVVNWARQNMAFEKLVLSGFSFGSYVTLTAQPAIRADRLFLVAPPVGLYDFSRIEEVSVPWEVVIGLDDEVVEVKEMLDWAFSREQSPSVYCRANASHFLHGQLIWLKKLILSEY